MKRVLFMGTPDFAVPCLKQIIDDGYDVVGVVTQPDKPKGRGHKMVPPPVKETAVENGIAVFQPETLKNLAFAEELKRLNPDIIVVVAYGKILPLYMLEYPKYGCINVHASILPKYRGAAPIQWSIINGEKTTGVTTMYMEEGLDTGDMLLKTELNIGDDETYGELHDRLSVLGGNLLSETLTQIFNGSVIREKQDDGSSCYAPMISKETGHIDWSKSAGEIKNLMQGLNPWPMAYSLYKGIPLKLISCKVVNKASGKCGEILSADKNGILIACGDGKGILVKDIQMQGSKKMDVSSYLNGHEIEKGIILE